MWDCSGLHTPPINRVKPNGENLFMEHLEMTTYRRWTFHRLNSIANVIRFVVNDRQLWESMGINTTSEIHTTWRRVTKQFVNNTLHNSAPHCTPVSHLIHIHAKERCTARTQTSWHQPSIQCPCFRCIVLYVPCWDSMCHNVVGWGGESCFGDSVRAAAMSFDTQYSFLNKCLVTTTFSHSSL